MFRLKHNLEGGLGMPSIIKIPIGSADGDTAFKSGDALCYKDGALSLCTGGEKAEWIAVADTKGGFADVIRVTASLVFEVPLNDVSEEVTLGAIVAFSADGRGVTSEKAENGAKIIDTQGAEKAYDKVLVVLA